MSSIKLARTGKKNHPSFRVIVVGKGNRIVETLGYYYPQFQPPVFQVNKERMEHWRRVGAKATSAVASLLKGKYEFRPYVPKKAEAEIEPAAAPVAEVPAEPEKTEEEVKENA